jgi:hypothetical protein
MNGRQPDDRSASLGSFSAKRLGAAPLLSVDADGMRYCVERDRVTGELWFTTHEPKVGVWAGALEDSGPTSTYPFDFVVLAGRLPRGAITAELEANGETHRAKCRPGLWLAAVPRRTRELRIDVHFMDRAGGVIGTKAHCSRCRRDRSRRDHLAAARGVDLARRLTDAASRSGTAATRRATQQCRSDDPSEPRRQGVV